MTGSELPTDDVERLLRDGEVDAAVELVGSLIATNERSTAILRLVVLFEWTGHYAEALRLLDSLGEREGANRWTRPWIRHRRAVVLAKSAPPAEAVDAIRQALEEGLPGDVTSWLRLMLIEHLDELGDVDGIRREIGLMARELPPAFVMRQATRVSKRHGVDPFSIDSKSASSIEGVSAEAIAQLPGHTLRIDLGRQTVLPTCFQGLAERTEVHAPAVDVFVLDDVTGVFVKGWTFFFDAQRRVIENCSTAAPPAVLRTALGMLEGAGDVPVVPATAALIQDRFTGANYYHWVLDWLTRVPICELAGPPVDRLVGHSLDAAFQRESLRVAGYGEDRFVSTQEHSVLRFESILVPDNIDRTHRSPAQFGHPHLLDWWHERVRDLRPPPTASPQDRLYLGRRARRAVANQDAVWPLLAARGFTRLDPGELSFAGQVAAFSGAECIVAPHGAATTNILFAPPGCRVLELFAPSGGTVGYFLLATALGHEYDLLAAARSRGIPEESRSASTTCRSSSTSIVSRRGYSRASGPSRERRAPSRRTASMRPAAAESTTSPTGRPQALA